MDPGTPDPTARFAPHADAYARGRPGYPAALVPMLQAIGIRAGTTVADLGAGTGQSCEPLLATGARVIAVEPNEPMRVHAAQRFAGEPRFSVVAGRAEATTLAGASIDHAAAMQALHWFDLPAVRAELRRIVRPGGRVVLVWNTRAQTTPFMRDLEAMVRRFAPTYEQLGHVGAEREARVTSFFGPDAFTHEQIAHQHEVDRAGFFDLLGSMSYMPKRNTEAHAQMLVAAGELVADRPRVSIEYTTDVYVGSV
ncbi:MAG TPA: class I SAM-dependent methyltransferase [Kofleriaceae bacterium]|jgi:SAM-dependent methyltransferase|nr:class I SAM-dependent methyltransferase [Kofleriaceae bacterium]